MHWFIPAAEVVIDKAWRDIVYYMLCSVMSYEQAIKHNKVDVKMALLQIEQIVRLKSSQGKPPIW